MTKVSVIVPVYNTEEYVSRCLDSLVSQTLDDYEVLVINDGSPDNSQKIIDDYVKKYSGVVKSYIKENGGLSDARNYGVKRASGNYISFVDSDDYVTVDFLEKLYNKATLENLDIVLCDTIEVYEKNEIYVRSNLEFSDKNINNYLISPPMACVRLYKKFLFDNYGFTKGILYEDLKFTPSLVLKTNKIGFVNEGMYYYVQRSGSIMKQHTFNKKLLDIFDVVKYNKDTLLKKFPLEIEYMYITHLLRTATLRFLEYKDTSGYLNKIRQIMKKEFPNWQKNIYYKKSSKKLRIICLLAYNKQYWLLKIIKKMFSK